MPKKKNLKGTVCLQGKAVSVVRRSKMKSSHKKKSGTSIKSFKTFMEAPDQLNLF